MKITNQIFACFLAFAFFCVPVISLAQTEMNAAEATDWDFVDFISSCPDDLTVYSCGGDPNRTPVKCRKKRGCQKDRFLLPKLGDFDLQGDSYFIDPSIEFINPHIMVLPEAALIDSGADAAAYSDFESRSFFVISK